MYKIIKTILDQVDILLLWFKDHKIKNTMFN